MLSESGLWPTFDDVPESVMNLSFIDKYKVEKKDATYLSYLNRYYNPAISERFEEQLGKGITPSNSCFVCREILPWEEYEEFGRICKRHRDETMLYGSMHAHGIRINHNEAERQE